VVGQHELVPPSGSKHRKKRIGRGLGSGHGRYSGRGIKGQKARSGAGIHPYFEGGQTPLVKRLPHKRGFSNIFRIEYSIVNVGRLNTFKPSSVVDQEELLRAGLIKSSKKPVKILGAGKLGIPLIVKADKFSATARRKIETAEGRVEVRSAAEAG